MSISPNAASAVDLPTAFARFEQARQIQLDAEEAGDLVTALSAQRTAGMWFAIVQRKWTAASAPAEHRPDAASV